MRRLFGSVRSRATLAATLVVAVALVAAGAAVLLSLRSSLIDKAGSEAERTAQNVVAQLVAGKSYDQLDIDDDSPVQVVDANGRLVAATEDLERISGTGTDAVQPQPRKGDAGAWATPPVRAARTPTTRRTTARVTVRATTRPSTPARSAK